MNNQRGGNRLAHPGRWSIGLVCVVVLVMSSLPGRAAECTVFAAASLSDALQVIAAEYQRNGGDQVYFNLAASSALARQIAEGARADLFFSADEAKVEQLQAKGLVKSQRKLLSNSLVFVVASDSLLKFPGDLAHVRRLALAETRTVPAGIYARKYLEGAGLWESVESRVVPTDNVRAALAAVESGNAEAAIVYKTDAAISKKVKVAFEVPAAEAPSIAYVLAELKEARNPDPAKRFGKYLEGKEAARIFIKYGFIVLPLVANGKLIGE
jgi:molybdate transport system substrate-binding protein